MIENNANEPLTASKQFEKFSRALHIVLGINTLIPDNYFAIMQLMNGLPKTTTLLLDETHEDVNENNS